MDIIDQGNILELDPNKEYWLFIKTGTLLAKTAKAGHIKKQNRQIFFVGNLNEFKFIENSDKIKGIVLEEEQTII